VRKIILLLALAAAALLATLGSGVLTGTSAHSSKVGYPNFACVAVGNLGFCIGPPTTD